MIVVTFEVIGGKIGSLTSGSYFKRKDFFHFILVYFFE